MQITYDADADVLWVQLDVSERVTSWAQLDAYRIVHYDATARPIAVEFLCASRGMNL